jgi:O-antigen ligase
MAIKPFPDGFVAARDALSSMALKAWKDSPWLGVGLGAFPLNAKFVASQVDWSVIAPGQQTPLNGWWTLLVERGITGALLIALGLAFLAWTYFTRLVKSFGRGWWRPACLVGPLVVMALTALAFVDCSYLRSDVLMPSAVAIALSACAFNTGSRDSGS